MKKSEIMNNAWGLYRDITATAPDCKNRAQFGLCLRAVWAQANAARTARREWESMDGPQQYAALARMAWTVKRRAEATGRSMDTDWIRSQDDALTVAGDAWARMLDALRRNDVSDAPRPLGHLMFAACSQAAHSIARAEIRHASACTSADTIAAANPDTTSGQTLLDVLHSATAAPSSSDPADTYAIRAAIAAAAQDDTTRVIIARLAAGHTVRDIATATKLSKSTVQRRIDKVRAIIADQLGIAL